MPLTRFKLSSIGDGGISTAKLADGAVTNAKLGDSSVNSAKIGVDVIAAEDLANNSVTVAELSNNAVTNAKIADSAVSNSKFDSTAKNMFGFRNLLHNPLFNVNSREISDRYIGAGAYAYDRWRGYVSNSIMSGANTNQLYYFPFDDSFSNGAAYGAPHGASSYVGNQGAITGYANYMVYGGGSASISNSFSKFGSYSLYVGNNGNDMEISDSSSRSLQTTRSFSFWVYKDGAWGDGEYFFDTTDKTSAANSYGSLSIALTGGQIRSVHQKYTDSAYAYITTNSSPLSASTWHHIAVVQSPNNQKIYVDGQDLATTQTGSAASVDTSPLNSLHIGDRTGNSSSFGDFYMDQLRIFDGYALTSSDVSDLYNESSDYIEQIVQKEDLVPGDYVLSWVDGGSGLSGKINGTTVANGGTVELTSSDLNNNVIVTIPSDATQPQFEKGTVATEFELRPVSMEESICGYYFKRFQGLRHIVYTAKQDDYYHHDIFEPMRANPKLVGESHDTYTNSIAYVSASVRNGVRRIISVSTATGGKYGSYQSNFDLSADLHE